MLSQDGVAGQGEGARCSTLHEGGEVGDAAEEFSLGGEDFGATGAVHSWVMVMPWLAWAFEPVETLSRCYARC